MTEYLARKDQKLSEHLFGVAKLASEFASVFGVSNTAYTTGLLHDLGKYTLAFQEYLQRSLRGENVVRGEVIHALQGAKFVAEKIKDSVISDIIGNVITTHHGGLFDNITEGERTLSSKTNKGEEKLHFEEAIKAFNPIINEMELKTEILNFCRKIQEYRLSPSFMFHLLTKVIYSCLVDADRCDAAKLTISDGIPDWGNLINLLEKYLTSFHDDTNIDKVRKNISNQC